MKSITVAIFLVCLSHTAFAKTPSSENVLSALFAKSDSITVQHNLTEEETTLSNFMADLLMSTHFTLTPSLECAEDHSVTNCILMFSTEFKKDDTEQEAPPDYYGDSFYLLFFSYSIDANQEISIVDNKIIYRIDQ